MALPESSVAERREFTATLAALVLVAAWLGAALFLAAVVAPAAFGVLPTRTLAGELIGRILPVLFVTGIIVGLLAVALELRKSRAPHWLARSVAGVLLAMACAVAQLGIAPRIARVREGAAGVLDTLAATSPARVEFGRLHMLSVAWLGVAILAALALVVFASLGLNGAVSKTEN